MTLSLRRPSHVRLLVRSLPASLAFWHGLLGIPVKLRGETHAELQTETFTVILDVLTGAEAGRIGWEIPSLDETARDLDAAGVAWERRVLEPPSAMGHALLLRDPDGHVLELVHYSLT